MTAPTIYDLFDAERFTADVEAFRIRHQHTRREAADIADMSTVGATDVMARGRAPTLANAIRLAKYADLALDEYIR